MKKILALVFLIACSFQGFSQVNDNCINAIPLCSTPNFTFFATSGAGSIVDFTQNSTVSNPVNNPFPPNSGCLKQGELKPQWLLITVGNAGLLEFVFGAANSPNPQAGCYDWAMWPYSPTTCADILNNTLPPIRCNWNATCGGGTGIASPANIALVGGNSGDFEPPLQVNACQQFVICISNFSGVNTLVSFQSLGTASLSCSPNCNPNYQICYGSSATIVPVNFAALSSPVFSIQPGNQSNTTGSFVVSPSVTTTYTTYITGTNQVGAVQTLTALSTVTVNPMPAVAPTVTNTTCTSTLNAVNMNLSFQPSGASPAYTVNWSPIPNGITNTSQTSFTGGIAPGPYYATVTTVDGCTALAGFTVDPQPDPAVIVVNPLGSSHTITCVGPVTLTAMNGSYSYTWSSNVAVLNSPSVVFTSSMVGTWMLTAQHPVSGCTDTQTFVISQNTTTPSGSVTPSFQSINCNLNSVTTISATANPSINVTHQILAPQGGMFSAQSYTTIYTPGGVGTFTHCVINDANGCRSCRTFTVTSSMGFPTYSITSPQNFTLGCNLKSVAYISIDAASTTSPSGGPVSYTVIGPPTSTVTPTGTLSGTNVYSVNVPGTWTVITKDNTTFCETRTPVSILSNTFAPDIQALVPRQILNCYVPSVTLRGQSLTNNVNYLWSFPGTPGNLQGDTITVKVLPASPNSSLIANYTLTITDNNNTCKSTSVIPIYQNMYLPKARVSPATSSITCKTATITLTNLSSTGIPPVTGFPYQQPVVGYVWEGPSPQQPEQLKTTYNAGVPGTYTLTVKDLNNGCTTQTFASVVDFRRYPDVNKPAAPPAFTLDCGAQNTRISPVITGSTTGFTYTWTAVPGASVSGVETATLTTNKTGNYRILVTNTLSGCASLGDVNVVDGTLHADFEASPYKGTAPLQVTFFNNSASSLGATGINGYWNFGNGTSTVTNSSNLTTVNTYSLPGTYKVTMFVSKGNCLDTAFKYIEVEIPSSLVIPNVFTPNGDNVNDLFFLKATNLARISISIYDRWGGLVYLSESEKGNIEWDGKYSSGKDAAEGTYFYIIKATGKDGQPFDKKGTVSLYR